MGLHFSHPLYLLLLPLVVAYTWWVSRRSFADLDRTRGRLANGVRMALLLLLILALAGTQLVQPADSLCTVFVVDISDSITAQERASVQDYIHQASKAMRSRDAAALVAFGADALLDHAPEDHAAIKQIISIPGTTRTDIAAGIQLAMASFPQRSGKQIVLFSDGNENLGNAIDQADLARGSDVHISVVPLQRDTAHGEALLLAANAPTQVQQGAPIPIAVIAETTEATEATIRLEKNGMPLDARHVQLKAGKNVVTFEPSVSESGPCHFHAVLDVPAGHDTIPDNNIADAYVKVTGKPKILIVANNAGESDNLTRALRANDVQVDATGPNDLPHTLADCAQYDSIVLDNVPAWSMSPAQMLMLRTAVHDTGMGLAMVGGETSFGAGGYLKTPVEEALPVDMQSKDRPIPTLTTVIVIDISGSMSMTEDGVPKVKLAGEAAAAAIDLMQPTDYVCVIGFDSAPTYAVRLTQVGSKSDITAQVSRLNAGGGGIDTYPALQEAYSVIRGQNTQIRHIILCADASDTKVKEGCIALANQMRQQKITLSVIGFGQPTDRDVPFHHELAAAGGGQAYLAERLSNLPQIFTRDLLLNTRSFLVEEPFQPRVDDASHPAVNHLALDSAPPLLGYVSTGMKQSPSARRILYSQKKDPVLAAWTYGLGRSIAFTSDATAHWGVHWLPWVDFATFWTQTVRWTLRNNNQADFQLAVSEEQGRASIVADAVTSEGEYRNLLDLRAHIAHIAPSGLNGPQASAQELPLEQTAAGRYEASFETKEIGAYEVTVEERDGDNVKGLQTATLVIPYSPEYQTVFPNLGLLSSIAAHTHGVVNPPAADIYTHLRFQSPILRDLWPVLIGVLSVLFLGDVAVRRLLLPWQESLHIIVETVRKRLPAWQWVMPRMPTVRQHTPVSDLLAMKEHLRRPQEETLLATAALRELHRRTTETTPGSTETTQRKDTVQHKDTAEIFAPAVPSAPPATMSHLLRKKRERNE